MTSVPTTVPLPVGSGRGWAYRTAWLVLPSAGDAAVADALRLAPTKQFDWAEGLDAATGDGSGELVLVTPPVDGRRFAVGALAAFDDLTMALLEDDASALESVATALGGEVQYFASHPGADLYVWAKVSPDSASRFVVTSADDGVGVHGVATPVEEVLGVDLITGDTDDDLDLIDDLVDETTVFAIAAAWSVDPSSFEDDRVDRGPALLGRRPHS